MKPVGVTPGRQNQAYNESTVVAIFDPIIQWIRARSREEWEQLAIRRWTDARIWIQEHAEVAALIAIGVGIFIVLAFKLVFTVCFLSGVAGLLIWQIAEPRPPQ